MNNPATARKLVLVSVLGLLIVATYKGRTGTVPTSTRLWGTGWLAIMLGVTADFAPQIAGPFALLVLAGSLTHGGDKAFTNLIGKAGAGAEWQNNPAQGPPGPSGPQGPRGKFRHPGEQGPQGPAGPTTAG